MNASNYVWYACYGSNLNEDRFLCYIKGGKPKNSSRTEIGCQDKTTPLKNTTYKIDRPLYFAKRAAHWENGGAGFIGLSPDPNNFTYSRKYLITKQQFVDLVNQENRTNNIQIDFQEIITLKSKVITEARYSNLLFLEFDTDQIPIFSFTTPEKMGESEFVKPAPIYLKTIIAGLKEIYNLPYTELAEYMMTKPGVTENYSFNEILDIVNYKL